MSKLSYIFFAVVSLCSVRLAKSQCALAPSLIDEIRNYQPVVNQIIDKVVKGDFLCRIKKRVKR